MSQLRRWGTPNRVRISLQPPEHRNSGQLGDKLGGESEEVEGGTPVVQTHAQKDVMVHPSL
eukprot:2557698-Pyramimonas_sp.AAC.1